MMTAAPACNTPCPVAPMVHDAIQLVRQLNRYAEHNCDDLWSRTSARLDELTQAASMLKATSPQGLFFQACVALGELDVLDSLLEGGEASAAEKKARRALEKVALALFSDELSVLADYYLTFAFKEAVAA